LKKLLLSAAGCISLAFGILGIIVPLLPTTPFLLLAAYLFLKSSEKLYTWLTSHTCFGTYILCYQKYRAISRKSKIFTLVLLWSVIGSSIIFVLEILWLRLLLLAIAVGVTAHVGRLRHLTREMVEKCRDVPSVREADK
jgi:uncharacterized protein